MKLFHNVMLHISVASVIIMTAWAVLFYWAIMDEVNDEVDDSLEDYSETLILRSLRGEELPSINNGSNNQFYIYDVSEEYANRYPRISYRDEMVYIYEKQETEPARILITIFETDKGFKELVVYTPTIDKLDLQKAILGWLVFLYCSILLSLLLLNVWVFRRNMKPLYELLSWLKKYKIGNRISPLHISTKISEFNSLNEAVIMSVERNEKLYEQQKIFIGNASHEMQTPLAICRNRLEMLMEDESLSEKQIEELAKTHSTLESLTKMNKSLLLLCKIENGQYSDEVKSIDFNEMLDHYIKVYKEVYEYKHITVNVVATDKFIVEINESLATILITNLLKNAFVHNSDNGTIIIQFASSYFSISSSGNTPLDGNRIFERFYQGKKKEGSTGLGLALVDTICKTNKLNVSYTYEDGMHKFIVTKQISRY